MIRPEALKKNVPLKWSPGLGAEVWNLFCACIDGDVATVSRLVKKDPSLVRSHHEVVSLGLHWISGRTMVCDLAQGLFSDAWADNSWEEHPLAGVLSMKATRNLDVSAG